MADFELIVATKEGRLDKYISKHSDLSRSRVQELLGSGDILVNGKQEEPSYKVANNDQITVHVPKLIPLNVEPEDIPLDIVYEDEDVIVVNKPQGMVVRPSTGHPNHTLVSALMNYTKFLAASPEGFRPGIVHRIDKDTSGLLMVAKNANARTGLESQLAHKTDERVYLAIVHGNFKEATGTIDAPIARNPKDRKRMTIVKDGKEAVTHFHVLEQYPGYALVSCQLETGRTHQIRVHMKYIGHPLAGDPLYGPKKTLRGHGQFLHTKILGFKQPKTEQWLEFQVDPPEIFQKELTYLRSLKR